MGWHVGFWNILGSVGFTLSAIFGLVYSPDQEGDRRWGVQLSTYLGTWSFLIGSYVQFVEASNMHDE